MPSFSRALYYLSYVFKVDAESWSRTKLVTAYETASDLACHPH